MFRREFSHWNMYQTAWSKSWHRKHGHAGQLFKKDDNEDLAITFVNLKLES